MRAATVRDSASWSRGTVEALGFGVTTQNVTAAISGCAAPASFARSWARLRAEGDRERDRPDRDGGVRDVEGRPACAADPNVYEVHDALGGCESGRSRCRPPRRTRAPREQPERGRPAARDHHRAAARTARRWRAREIARVGLSAQTQPDGAALVVDQAQLHEVADDPDRQMSPPAGILPGAW